MMNHLRSMTQPELQNLLKELGQPAFRAKQLYIWLHKGARSYDEMTNLPKSLRDTLAEHYPLTTPKVVRPAPQVSIILYTGTMLFAIRTL